MARWPTADDLVDYLGRGSVGTARMGTLADAVAAAIDVAWGDLDESKMPDQDGDVDDRCPPAVRSAVLVLAARLHARSTSTVGVVAAGDVALRIARQDPDYRALIGRYAVSPDP